MRPLATALDLPGRDRDTLAALLEQLRPNAVRLRFKAEETIVTEAAPATHIYQIASGCVRLCRHLPGRRRPVADFLYAGGLIGLGSAPSYALTAEAVTAVTVFSYSRPQFERFHLGSAWMEMMAELTAALARSQAHMLLLNSFSARERLAAFLLDQMRQDQLVYSNGKQISLPMNRQDIADYLGLTVETVCRAFSFLRRMAIIELRNSQMVVVKDENALTALAEGRLQTDVTGSDHA